MNSVDPQTSSPNPSGGGGETDGAGRPLRRDETTGGPRHSSPVLPAVSLTAAGGSKAPPADPRLSTSAGGAAPTLLRRAAPVNETVRRLTAIKPSERVRYYRGDAKDVEKSEILQAVFGCAERLAMAGRVELREEKNPVSGFWGKPLHLTDFIAIGRP